MRTKCAFAGLAALLASFVAMPAMAQTGLSKTPANLNSEIGSFFPDQLAGLIPPFNERQVLLDMVASNSNLNAANNFLGTLTITPPTGLPTTNSSGLIINQNLTGTITGGGGTNFNYNNISITDNLAITGFTFGNGVNIALNFGGASTQGGRQAFIANAFLNTTTSGSSSNRNYVGVVGIGQANANDNGTNPAAFGTSAGAVFGGNFEGVLNVSGATAFLGVSAAEFNTRIVTGASAFAKTLIQVSSDGLDRVSGTVIDAMFWLYNQGSGSAPGWNTGILFDNGGGVTGNVWPIKSTGTIIQTGGGGTAAHGIDFSNTTFSSDAFKSTGFLVSGTGLITSGAVGGANGSLTLNGSTSGTISIVTSATANQLTINQGTTFGANGGNAGAIALAGSTSGAVALVPSATGGHLTYAGSGAAPTNNACTGFALATGSTDIAGRVTFTSATSCAINFGTAFANAPFCQASGGTAASTVQVATTTSLLTVTFGTAQTAMSWTCYGA